MEIAPVRAMAAELRNRLPRLDVMVNNAAAMFSSRRETADGLEAKFGVNYFAPTVLTLELLPVLEASTAGRIVNLSSVGYKKAKPDYFHLQATKNYSMQRDAESHLAMRDRVDVVM
jgi:retinol dehydrogenase 14